MATKSAPITSESGLTQLVTGSPAALPTGTRPPAIAPTTVPMKNGVRSEASPKNRTAQRPAAGAPRGVLEREPGAAQHDPERREAERDEQRREDRLERRREPGPEHDEHEDQPDVVGLPDRSDRPVDQLARPPAAVAPTREQAPERRRRSPRRRRRRTSSPRPEDDGDGVGARSCGRPGQARGRGPVRARTGTSSGPGRLLASAATSRAA